ncbi:response regulator transcription factor [uncultured Acetobacteroides sp.]|uniref:response regulator transcription factor n=1 Tax=uncultured Acetobacteroides sp. TaxID=1760811 RepID=UPI0029F53F46|nr:response regulator transcription factor [uncultured Acetobacteroides sp.]
MSNVNVLLVEDDTNFGSVLKAYLSINEFNVTLVADGARAFKTFIEGEFDICVLDVMLPNVDGFTIARRIKEHNSRIPLIFLTAKTLKNDIQEGFSIGADDYITKPFDSEVLIWKINAILNRDKLSNGAANAPKTTYEIGSYTFDSEVRTLTHSGVEDKLSPREADLLKLLVENANSVLQRDKALLTIWKDDSYFAGRSMDVYITKLRKYLKDDPSIEISSVHGTGFMLKIKH